MSFDELPRLRNIARERAIESLEFFANNVLCAQWDSEFARTVQSQVQNGEEVILAPRAQRVLDAWLCVIGKIESPLPESETLSWLFSEAVCQ